MQEAEQALFTSLFEVSPTPPGQPKGTTSALNADPALIPGFELLQCLGKGGMGVVYKARQVHLDRIVALKFLRRELCEDPEYVQRFLGEARTAGRLRHLNLVNALDCGVVKKLRFMVMEYVEGRSLDEILEERGALDERTALRIVRQVAEGLDYAWQSRIIHRDIKPQNIMLTADGTAKVCDLGLCRSVKIDLKLTSTEYVNCTPSYASPEQARNDKNLDCRTDLYSLGITFYQMVVGRLPFESASPADAFVKHASAPRVPPSKRNPSVCRAVSDLILRMIEPDPERRPPNPEALVEEIRRIQMLPAAEGGPRLPETPVRTAAPDLLKIAGVDVPGPLGLAVRVEDDCAVVELRGKLLDELDRAVEDAVRSVIKQGIVRVVIDCSRLDFLNSRGASVFLALADRLRGRGGDLRLAAASRQALVVLERLGVTVMVPHLERVEAAVRSLKALEPAPPAAPETPAGPARTPVRQPLPSRADTRRAVTQILKREGKWKAWLIAALLAMNIILAGAVAALLILLRDKERLP